MDLSSEDRLSSANSIRQACFYLVNHGVEEELLEKVFEQNKKFFSLPVEEKIKFPDKNHIGYKRLYHEKLDSSLNAKGDFKESFYFGLSVENLPNQYLSDDLPSWRSTMEANYKHVLEEVYGASAHSDYGMVTLLLTDGVPGLQVCREKSKQPLVWEDVASMSGSALHRVLSPGQDRYSVVFFMNPNKDCTVEYLGSCCSESSPPRFPPIRSIDYLEERLSLIQGL